MRRVRGLFASLFVLAIMTVGASRSAAAPADAPVGRAEAPAGQVTWAVHVSLAPTWFDPAETSGILTPFMVLYALHDALVKPMPGTPMAPSLAESWTASTDGLSYEFVLRQGVRFHNGELLTADDVKFSFERYRGVSARALKDRVRLAVESRSTPRLGMKPAHSFGGHWVLFPEQWDLKSLWAGRRVRLAFAHAIDSEAMNKSITLGFSRMTGSMIPMDFDFYRPVPPYAYDPRKAKQLLAEAGYPSGFDAGELSTDANFADYTEAVVNYLAAIGIRTRMRSLERAAYFSQLRDKKLRPLVYLASGAYGNAATRIDSFLAAGGLYTYGS